MEDRDVTPGKKENTSKNKRWREAAAMLELKAIMEAKSKPEDQDTDSETSRFMRLRSQKA